MQQSDAVVGEELCAFAEERIVEADADMLEHADRDDAVELAFDVAIIDEPERRVLRAGRAPSARFCARRNCSCDSVMPVTRAPAISAR